MKSMEFLSEKAISANLVSDDKKSVIKELTDLLIKAGELKPKIKDQIVSTLLKIGRASCRERV